MAKSSKKRSSRSKRNQTSVMTELAQLAGDIMHDGVHLFMGDLEIANSSDSSSVSSEEDTKGEEETLDEEEVEQAREDEDDTVSKSSTIERREEALRKKMEREAENMRIYKDIGETREKELKEKLAKLDELYGSNAYDDDVSELESVSGNKEKLLSKRVYGKASKAPKPEEQSFQVVYGKEAIRESEPKLNSKEGKDDEATWSDNEYAEQIVHEMMQLLHHSRKNRDEATRLIEYKKVAISHHREVHPELDVHITKIVNYKKLEVSTRRFMDHMKNRDIPRDLRTLGMEKELLQNIQALRKMSKDSKNMTASQDVISLVDVTE